MSERAVPPPPPPAARRVALALLCALAAAAHAHAHGHGHAHAHSLGKRAEMSPVPFTFAARYGRSPDRQVAPRNDRYGAGGVAARACARRADVERSPGASSQHGQVSAQDPGRWLLTTRYGKRSEPPLEQHAPAGRGASLRGASPVAPAEGGRALACRYTGVLALFRCARARPRRGGERAPRDHEPRPDRR